MFGTSLGEYQYEVSPMYLVIQGVLEVLWADLTVQPIVDDLN
jgi:hypothetical protein